MLATILLSTFLFSITCVLIYDGYRSQKKLNELRKVIESKRKNMQQIIKDFD